MELSQLKAQQQSELEKCEKNLIAAEFKALRLQEKLEVVKLQAKDMTNKQQQTTPPESPRGLQPTIVESDDQTEIHV